MKYSGLVLGESISSPKYPGKITRRSFFSTSLTTERLGHLRPGFVKNISSAS